MAIVKLFSVFHELYMHVSEKKFDPQKSKCLIVIFFYKMFWLGIGQVEISIVSIEVVGMEPVTKEVVFANGKRKAIVHITFANEPSIEKIHKLYDRCLPDALKWAEEKANQAG